MEKQPKKVKVTTTIRADYLMELQQQGIKVWEAVEAGAVQLLGKSVKIVQLQKDTEGIHNTLVRMQKDLLTLRLQMIAINKVIVETSNRNALKEYYEQNYQR